MRKKELKKTLEDYISKNFYLLLEYGDLFEENLKLKDEIKDLKKQLKKDDEIL